jgi:hypothetical protein
VSIDYCILTMEIMEIYHKCSSDNDSKIVMENAFRFSPTIGVWQEYNKKQVQDHRHEHYDQIHLYIIPL